MPTFKRRWSGAWAANARRMPGAFVAVLALRCVLGSLAVAAEDSAVPIRPSSPLPPPAPRTLGTQSYLPLEDEIPFIRQITEKPINFWSHIKIPRPTNLSDEQWRQLQAERRELEKDLIPVEQYELASQSGQYVGWFGIVRGREFDAAANHTRLLVEHKYFDGLTDTHMHIVSIHGAGDFRVVLPGKIDETQIPRLALVAVYGKVSRTDQQPPELRAEYVRLWDWGLFTFMDYGQDKSNPQWVKLRKVAADDVYDPHPARTFYEQRLGPR